MKHSTKSGFTLIELLITIAIISLISVTVFVALNPTKNMADARNARRWIDVGNILNAMRQYSLDTGNTIPAPSVDTQIGTAGSGCDSLCVGVSAPSACFDMGTYLNRYLKRVPKDPRSGSNATTGYAISVGSSGLITITACGAEQGETIDISSY